MKKTAIRLFALILAILTFTMCASASNFDNLADELASVGMFKGTGNGYELDAVPTRAQAAVMLVRMFGEEENATNAYNAGSISHPFTDVPAWAAPHIAWLYKNGLTNGVSATLFDPNGVCTAQMYCTFMLRALGYSDIGSADFTYAKAIDFASGKGIIDDYLLFYPFTRDTLVAVSWQGLVTDIKGGGKMLIQKLVDSGAIKASAAKPIIDRANIYRAIEDADSKTFGDGSTVATDATYDVTATVNDGTYKAVSRNTADIQIKAANSNIEIGAVVSILSDGDQVSSKVGEWYKNGVFYITDYNTFAYKAASGFDDELDSLFNQAVMANMYTDNGAYMFKKISYEKKNGNTVYTLVSNSAVAENLAVAAFAYEGASYGLLPGGDITYVITVDRNGMIKTVRATFATFADIGAYPYDSTDLYRIDYDLLTTINATGSKVSVKYPDFSNFVDISTAY